MAEEEEEEDLKREEEKEDAVLQLLVQTEEEHGKRQEDEKDAVLHELVQREEEDVAPRGPVERASSHAPLVLHVCTHICHSSVAPILLDTKPSSATTPESMSLPKTSAAPTSFAPAPKTNIKRKTPKRQTKHHKCKNKIHPHKTPSL